MGAYFAYTGSVGSTRVGPIKKGDFTTGQSSATLSYPMLHTVLLFHAAPGPSTARTGGEPYVTQ